MTDVKFSEFIEHLKEKWKGSACPLCKSGSWTVSDKVFELREYHDGNLVIGGSPIVPVVPVTCDNCGNTVLVNSIISGNTKQEAGEKP